MKVFPMITDLTTRVFFLISGFPCQPALQKLFSLFEHFQACLDGCDLTPSGS